MYFKIDLHFPDVFGITKSCSRKSGTRFFRLRRASFVLTCAFEQMASHGKESDQPQEFNGSHVCLTFGPPLARLQRHVVSRQNRHVVIDKLLYELSGAQKVIETIDWRCKTAIIRQNSQKLYYFLNFLPF